MKPLHLRDFEAKEWKIGTNVIERKMIKCGSVIFPIRIKPNDKVAIKETWSLDDVGRLMVKSSCVGDITLKATTSIVRWRSPVTMPLPLVRSFATITSVEAIEHDGQWFYKITMEAT